MKRILNFISSISYKAMAFYFKHKDGFDLLIDLIGTIFF